ncbi:unnamed protein product [Discosporangium mesarthrocarpum]
MVHVSQQGCKLWAIFLLHLFLQGLTTTLGFAVPARTSIKIPKSCPPVVILPGFGNDAKDYINPLDAGEEKGFVSNLEKRGLQTFVVPVERKDWFNVAKAIFTPEFWSGTCTPNGPAYSWYLQKVRETVAEARETSGSDKIILMGHSAGGWLGRAAMGGGKWEEGVASEDVVAGLVTLGTPQFPGPMDMTRGALTYTDLQYPGAFLRDRGVFYVTVAGAAVEGDSEAERGSRERFAFGSYKTVCGAGAVMGDACVPLMSAHLDGAEQVTLDGVFHSVDRPDDWYGADPVVDCWLGTVLEGLRVRGEPPIIGLRALASLWGR